MPFGQSARVKARVNGDLQVGSQMSAYCERVAGPVRAESHAGPKTN